jgi:PhnB protein
MDNPIQLSPYLNFNGNCEEAMQFYNGIFGGKLDISRFGDFDSQMPVPDNYKTKVMHSYLGGEHVSFMASDSPPNVTPTVGNNVQLSISGGDGETLTKYFNALAEGGTITVALDKQAWGDTFGMLTDKFGIYWMVNISAPKA